VQPLEETQKLFYSSRPKSKLASAMARSKKKKKKGNGGSVPSMSVYKSGCASVFIVYIVASTFYSHSMVRLLKKTLLIPSANSRIEAPN
jgi:hypothetical protein